MAFVDNLAMSHRAGDEVPKDPVKENPNVLLRISAYSTINRKPAKGYVPKVERAQNETCGEEDKDCVKEKKQGQWDSKKARKDEL